MRCQWRVRRIVWIRMTDALLHCGNQTFSGALWLNKLPFVCIGRDYWDIAKFWTFTERIGPRHHRYFRASVLNCWSSRPSITSIPNYPLFRITLNYLTLMHASIEACFLRFFYNPLFNHLRVMISVLSPKLWSGQKRSIPTKLFGGSRNFGLKILVLHACIA